MPSTYTKNLGLEKPATGEQAGTWGNTANSDYDYIDNATDGNIFITLSASSYNLNTSQATNCEGRNKVIVWTGGTPGDTTINITPNTAQKLYLVTNSSAATLHFSQGSGGSFVLEPGYSSIIYCDGAGSTARVDGALFNPKFGSVYVSQNLIVSGSVTFNSAITFAQPATFTNNVTMTGPVTFSGYIVYNPTLRTSATADIYFRNSSGAMDILPIGSPGQLLQAKAGPAIGWATVQLAIGSAVANSSAYRVYYSDQNNVLGQDAYIQINPGVGLGVGINPSHTVHVGINYPPQIWLDAANTISQARQFIYATNGVLRWNLFTPASEAESGANAGSNLALFSYTDSGQVLGCLFSSLRSTTNLTVGAYGDYGSKLAVIGSNAGQPTVIVRGASGQTAVLESWQNSSGSVVASIDNTGKLFLANTSFLQLDATYGGLDLHGTVAGHPWGAIHVGPENATPQGPGSRPIGVRGSIAFETAPPGNDAVPAGIFRIYFRNGNIVIQYRGADGAQYGAYLPLIAPSGGAGPASWNYGGAGSL
jgi:hypothetical protein